MGKRIQSKWWLAFTVVVAALLVVAMTSVALGVGHPLVTPTEHSGNTPHDSGTLTVTSSGTYGIPGHPGYQIIVTVSPHDPQGDEVAFASDIPVLKVLMKGGDNYNEYDYGSSGATSDSKLICPLNGGGEIPTLSHAVFYFGELQATTTTTAPATTTTTQATTTTTQATTTTTQATSTTTAPATTTTTQATTTTTILGLSSTTTTLDDINDTSTTVGGLTTVSEIQAGGGGTAGPGAGAYGLGAFALLLLSALGWAAVRPALRRK